jgi:hypothetical protein
MRDEQKLQNAISLLSLEQTLVAFKAKPEPCPASIALVEDLIKSLRINL